MLGLPPPYPDELIYSLVARAGIYCGILSPKSLLDDIYEDRKVVATVDLPGHLDKIAFHYPKSLGLTPLNLIYRHTLFPLYAPFVGESRRLAGIQAMSGLSRNMIHTTFGIAASSVKQPKMLRYCPKCFETQRKEYGEQYWVRQWQVAAANVCHKHHTPLKLHLSESHFSRHAYSLAEAREEDPDCDVQSPESETVTRFVLQLLDINPGYSPAHYQWACFYQDLVHAAGFHRGKHILHADVHTAIGQYWSLNWLLRNGIFLADKDTCWSKTILRKHRKAFSFLQHLVMISSLSDKPDIDPRLILEQVKQYPSQPSATVSGICCSTPRGVRERRRKWLTVLKKDGCKKARIQGYGALYSWLYRHDRDWLLKINRRYQKACPAIQRVDWMARDKACVQRLFRLLYEMQSGVESPRLSRAFFISRSQIADTIEKNPDKLPRVMLFLDAYTESVAEYQIRRLTNTFLSLHQRQIPCLRWRLLRFSGLSEERLKTTTRIFLKGITEE